MDTILKILIRITLIVGFLYLLFALPAIGENLQSALDYFAKGRDTKAAFTNHILQRTVVGVVIIGSTALISLLSKSTYKGKE